MIQAQDGEGGETKMYIRELKEHVIIQGKEEAIDETQYSEVSGHLIIDGQVFKSFLHNNYECNYYSLRCKPRQMKVQSKCLQIIQVFFHH